MWRYLKSLKTSWKTWKYWKKSGLNLHRGFIPSETYVKYQPNEKFGGRIVLNAGCGRNVYKTANVTNTDLFKGDGVDIIVDLSKPLPFNDNQFDFILANHVMEHVPNWFDCFKEFARVLKPGGTMELWFPPISSDTIFTYRDHINRIGIESFSGIADIRRSGTNLWAAQEFEKLDHLKNVYLIQKKIRPALKWWVFFAPNWLMEFYSLHLRNCFSEEGYFFTKRG